ncbi:MAG: hypothetical protein ACHQFW_04700 [Chitinophagales bacterium]
MRSLFTLGFILLSMITFAGNETNNCTDAEKATVVENIADLLGGVDLLNALGINGQADVTIQVDENGVVHVAEVQANDYLLEYHIRHSIDGVKMIVSDSLVGKTVSFIMNVVQSK